MAVRDDILRILSQLPNGHNDARSIARIIEYEHDKPAGSYNLAVRMEAGRLAKCGLLRIHPPRDRWSSAWYALSDKGFMEFRVLMEARRVLKQQESIGD